MSIIIEFRASLYDRIPSILIAENAGGFCLILPIKVGKALIISFLDGLTLLIFYILPSKSSVSVATPQLISNS